MRPRRVTGAVQIPRSLAIAAGFGLIWAAMTYAKNPHDWVAPAIGFVAFVVIGPLLGLLIRFILRLLRRTS
jgi:hypothetical protein